MLVTVGSSRSWSGRRRARPRPGASSGGAVVAGVGLGAGLLARPEAPAWRELTRAGLDPGAARGADRRRRPACSRWPSLVVVAAAVATLWVVAGRATIGDVVRGLGLDAIGGVVLAFAELAFVPNLVVWAIAWLTGSGFSVGSGTHFAPDAVVGGPLPAVPLLGALPTPDVAGPATSIVPIVLVGDRGRRRPVRAPPAAGDPLVARARRGSARRRSRSVSC